MALQFLAARSGRRGRPVSPERVGRLVAIVDEVDHQSIASTARHLFYRLLSRGVIPKSEAAYDRLLDDLLALRRSGDVAWSAITDGTRTKTRWVGYGSLAEAAAEWQRQYRRDIWRDNPATGEVWTESRGLLATINEVAGEHGVTTLGVGGFNSASVGYETSLDVRRAIARGQTFTIFHFGDYDPSGEAIGATAERDIRYHLSPAEQPFFRFGRCALTLDQVRQYDLPSAPVKRNADGSIRGGHARTWATGTTELDALDPLVLQALVRAAIESLIDPAILAAVRVAEASERDIVRRMAASLGGPL